MPRPRFVTRPIEKNISIPEDIVGQVDLLLYSDVEGKIPHGAWKTYIVGLIQADLKARAEAGKRMQQAWKGAAAS